MEDVEPELPPKRSRFDWSLLTIAVAIILVLIALLIPALGAAREKARRATCMCNLKQIGLAMRLFRRQQGAISHRRYRYHARIVGAADEQLPDFASHMALPERHTNRRLQCQGRCGASSVLHA